MFQQETGWIYRRLARLQLNQSFPGQPAPGRGGGQAAAGGLPVADVHFASDLPHGIDHLVDRDRELHPSERHFDARKRHRGAVALR